MSTADDFTLGSDFPLLPNNSAAAHSFEPTQFEQPSFSAPVAPKVSASRPAKAQSAKTEQASEPVVYHRIAEVRRLQGISIRSASRRMGIPMEQVRREERPDANLTMEQMIRWQRAMEVPLVDLIEDDNSPLSTPVLMRAKWLRLMKTVKALLEVSESKGTTRMAQMLESQVLEVMPELKDVSAWHSVGQRRTQDEQGRIAESPISSSFARDGLR